MTLASAANGRHHVVIALPFDEGEAVVLEYLRRQRVELRGIRNREALKTGLGQLAATRPSVFSLLKLWLLGTHQGSVAGEHLHDYLKEFAFRLNRRGHHHQSASARLV